MSGQYEPQRLREHRAREERKRGKERREFHKLLERNIN
jgi:hypothetical protein